MTVMVYLVLNPGYKHNFNWMLESQDKSAHRTEYIHDIVNVNIQTEHVVYIPGVFSQLSPLTCGDVCLGSVVS